MATVVVTEIDRAIRIDSPATAEIGKPVNLSVSVYQGLSARDIALMAISPEGIFYPVENENFTFDRAGRWGVVALIGDLVLLGKPLDISEGGFKLVMPGLGTILAAISLLLLLSLVPIWFMGQAYGPRSLRRSGFQGLRDQKIHREIRHHAPPPRRVPAQGRVRRPASQKSQGSS